jgi:hypothetical protein
MSFTIEKKQDILIVKLKESSCDLSLVAQRFGPDFKHIIFDLLNLLSLNESDLKNFTTFGKENVTEGSFVIILKGEFQEDYPIVPTLEEAFDFIEMENIERMLN